MTGFFSLVLFVQLCSSQCLEWWTELCVVVMERVSAKKWFCKTCMYNVSILLVAESCTMTIINFIIKNSFIERQTINVPHENATIYNMNAGTIFTLHSAF